MAKALLINDLGASHTRAPVGYFVASNCSTTPTSRSLIVYRSSQRL